MITDQELLNARLLIVDDNPDNVDLLEKTLSMEGYTSILSTTDPRQALDLYQSYKPHLVLLDLNMPYLDGFEVMAKFKKIEKNSYIPVLVLTALHDKNTKLRALSEGAQDFLTKPFDKLETITRISNMLRVRMLNDAVVDQNIILEQKVQERTIELQETRIEVIHRLGRAAEYRDNETGEHIIRLSHMCALMAKLAGMRSETQELLLLATPMHDIGKIGIPDSILLKPGKLTSEEWQKMQSHTTIGADILDGHDSELMCSSREIALTHHEKWNGTGYPNHLKETEIPIEGRITGLVDVFDALTSKRPYKDPYPVEKACVIIREGRGKHFDPKLTDLFLNNVDEFSQTKELFSNEDKIATKENFELSERDQCLI